MVFPVAAAMLGSAAIGAAGSMFSAKRSADFAQESYKHRYQWQVKDLKKAGLNPMLAVQQGAPNVPQPNIPDIGESITKGAQVGLAGKMANEQMYLMRAQGNSAIAAGRKQDAEAQAIEATLPYSADNARVQSEQLKVQLVSAQESMKKITAEVKSIEQLYKHQEKLYPLLRDYQQYMNKAAALGIPEKAADAKFWSQVGVYGKYAEKGGNLAKDIASVVKSFKPGITIERRK